MATTSSSPKWSTLTLRIAATSSFLTYLVVITVQAILNQQSKALLITVTTSIAVLGLSILLLLTVRRKLAEDAKFRTEIAQFERDRYEYDIAIDRLEAYERADGLWEN